MSTLQMRVIVYMALLGLLFYFGGCSKKKVTPPANPSFDYFPLAVGNNWTYEEYRNDTLRAVRYSMVAAETTLSTVGTVFILECGFLPDSFGCSYDYRYARKTSKGIEFYSEYFPSETEPCIWPLPFSVGNSWSCPWNDYVISAKESVLTPLRTFENCYKVTVFSDGNPVSSYWYAPNVGEVKVIEGSSKTMLLVAYQLH